MRIEKKAKKDDTLKLVSHATVTAAEEAMERVDGTVAKPRKVTSAACFPWWFGGELPCRLLLGVRT